MISFNLINGLKIAYIFLLHAIIINQNMLEIMNEHLEPIANLKENQQKQEERGLKLPRIQKLPTRERQREVKSSAKLPAIKNELHIEPTVSITERETPSDTDFVGQVERKIRLVLQQQNIAELQQSEQSDEDTFEKKIIENKEIIKAAKRRNQKKKKENEHMSNNLKINPNLNRKISHNNKNQMYEKRMRQYKQVSAQNSNLQKKKDILANNNKNGHRDSNQLKEVKNFNGALREFVSNKEINIREVKSKGELVPINKIIPSSNHKNESSIQPRKLKKQFSQKILSPIQKNEQLFDAIHNYLQNPKRHDIQAVNPMKIGKERAQLQKKLKWYEQKLHVSVCEDNQKLGLKHKLSINSQETEPNKSEIKLVTSSHWHKIGLSQRGIFAQQTTSFDKELDRINHYLHKNQQSLDKYVQNQKLLVDVQLASRRKSSKDKNRAEAKSQLQ